MLLAPVPLTVVCVEIASLFTMCLKPKENQCILHAFDVLDRSCGWWNREFLNRPLDILIVHFFLRCPEVALGIPKPTSGHLARRLRRRCPRVGLGIPGSDVASVCAKFSFSLRLRWRAGFWMRRRFDAKDRASTVNARRLRRPTTWPGPARTSRGPNRIF